MIREEKCRTKIKKTELNKKQMETDKADIK
jgi:hypothetical protein